MRGIRNVPTLDKPQDVLAAVPHLLGFHPQDSLVVLCMEQRQTIATMRVDLPPVLHRRASAIQLVDAARGQNADGVLLLVIGGGVAEPSANGLPHSGLIEVMKETVSSQGMRTIFTAWAESTKAGARWHSYEDPDWTGTLPDPRATELAAATAAAGLVTFASREELAAQLAPAADEILARRTALLDDEPTGCHSDHDAPAAFRLVRDTIVAASDRRDPLGDDEVVRLARALSDNLVRDACLSFAFGSRADAAERLWLELTRGCPVSVRANPAVLLALSAYLRGDGSLASIAVDQALSAHPGHMLGTLLREALDAGLAPERIHQVIHDSAIAEAERFLTADAERRT